MKNYFKLISIIILILLITFLWKILSKENYKCKKKIISFSHRKLKCIFGLLKMLC